MQTVNSIEWFSAGLGAIPVDYLSINLKRKNMKIIPFIVFFLFVFNINLFSQTNNYNNGNGTIIEIKTFNNQQWEIRKHIQKIQIGNLARKHNMPIYENHSQQSKIIYELKLDDYINISQIAQTNIGEQFYIWLKIDMDNNTSGWLFFGEYSSTKECSDIPYLNNRWEILYYISTNRTWTIRKMLVQGISVWEELNIRNKPGVIDTTVISKIVPPINQLPQVNLEILEATEETETIDGRNDRWLKIRYNGIEGWIFGGYTGTARGGPKYYLPESIIAFGLGYY